MIRLDCRVHGRRAHRLATLRQTITNALLMTAVVSMATPVTAQDCATPGQWLTPGNQHAEAQPPMGWDRLARQRVVLLGEQHDQAAHHRWQLSTITALHSHQADMAIGLEMLPRKVQPALDQWVAGELDESQLLDRTQWYRYWGRDAERYLPILRFARDHRLPLIALNVTPEQRRELSDPASHQWTLDQRHGVPVPLAASARYRQRLMESFEQHSSEQLSSHISEAFIRAQLVWDSSMAAALANASHQHSLVVAILGLGHVQYADGVPHQLTRYGISDVTGLMPMAAADACLAPTGVADALFIAEPDAPSADTPRLGINVERTPQPLGPDRLVITAISPDSPAQYAGLEEGDQVVAIAGHEVRDTAQVRALMARSLPGSLIPVEVLRAGERRQQLVTLPSPSP